MNLTRANTGRALAIPIALAILAAVAAGCGSRTADGAAVAAPTAPDQGVANNPQASAVARAQAAQQAEIGKRQQLLMQQAQTRAHAAQLSRK